MSQKLYTYDEAIAHCDKTVTLAGAELAREIAIEKKYNQANLYV